MTHTFYIINVYIHILAAMVWIGGLLFMVLVIVPILRNPSSKGQAATFIRKVGVQFRWVGWIALSILVITGIINLGFRGYHWVDFIDGDLWRGSFGHNLAIKLGCVLVVLVISAIHDFRIGPRATKFWQEQPDGPEVKRLRGQAKMIGRLNLILGLIIVFEAVMLVRGSIW